MKFKCFIITLYFSTLLSAQNDVVRHRTISPELKEKNVSNSQDSNASKLMERRNVWLESGINVSGFQNIGSNKRFGYEIGLTFSYKLSSSTGIDISGLVSRQNIFVNDKETASLSGEFVHRIIYDTKISLLFLELPVMINFKICDIGSSSFYIGLGLGYSISIKDYSKNLNFVVTDEIVDISPPVDEYYIEDSVFDNSGINMNTGIRLNYDKFIVKLSYINKRYDLKRIGKEHTFSFHIGYQLN